MYVQPPTFSNREDSLLNIAINNPLCSNEFQNDLKRSMLRVTEQKIVECKEELSTLVVNFLRNCMESYLIINEQAESSNMVNFQVLISNVIEDIYVSKQAESIFCTMKPSLIPNPVEDGFRF